MKKYALALLASAAFIPAAYAADLGAANMPVYAKAPAVPAPATNWSGFYAGLNVGYGFGGDNHASGGQTHYENTSHDSADTEWFGDGGPAWNMGSDLSGVVGGGQIGYNFQFDRSWVLGVEADFQGSDLKGSSSQTNSTAIALLPANPGGADFWPIAGTADVTQKVDWYGTVRGRLGVTTDDNSLLVYGTGGLAYGRVSQTFGYTGTFLPDAKLGFIGASGSGVVSNSEMKVGWTLGAGAEWRPAGWGNWSMKAEYLYTDLGSSSVDLVAPAFRADGAGSRVIDASDKIDTRFQTVRVGVNYAFH